MANDNNENRADDTNLNIFLKFGPSKETQNDVKKIEVIAAEFGLDEGKQVFEQRNETFEERKSTHKGGRFPKHDPTTRNGGRYSGDKEIGRVLRPRSINKVYSEDNTWIGDTPEGSPKLKACNEPGMGKHRKHANKKKTLSFKKSVLNPHKCSFCHKRYRDNCVLKQHIKSIHQNQKIPCEVCKKKFASRNGLLRHLESHSAKFKFMCEKCGKGFVNKNHLETHVLVHENKKVFKCPCGKAYNTPSHLAYHTQRCDQSIPMKCEKCNFKCYARSRLREHISKKHKLPPTCVICGETFVHRNLLYRHRKAHHPTSTVP